MSLLDSKTGFFDPRVRNYLSELCLKFSETCHNQGLFWNHNTLFRYALYPWSYHCRVKSPRDFTVAEFYIDFLEIMPTTYVTLFPLARYFFGQRW